MTGPNIAYAVHVISQFMHAPHTTHLHGIKHIFCYLQDAVAHEMWIWLSTSASLVVASFDADWVGCEDFYRLAIGYTVFLGPNLIA